MILWIMLIFGFVCLMMSIHCFVWHDKLNKELDRCAQRVDYDEYLITGLGAYLLLPASLFIIGASIFCLLAA